MKSVANHPKIDKLGIKQMAMNEWMNIAEIKWIYCNRYENINKSVSTYF